LDRKVETRNAIHQESVLAAKQIAALIVSVGTTPMATSRSNDLKPSI
jgi:GTP1/Obg family GTP-binding protein